MNDNGKAFFDTNVLIYSKVLQSLDCDVLYTEDLQDGQLIDGSLMVKNPF